MHKRANIRFYGKVDARDVLSPSWQQYADRANYVSHRVLVGRAFWHVDDDTNQYTLLKSAYLRNVVGSHILMPLLSEMQRTGLIERDRYYIEGHKSFGYRIGDRFRNKETRRIECHDRRLHDKIMNIKRHDYRHYTRVHRHLFNWLGKVELDLGTAMKIIDQVPYEDAKLSRQEWRDLNAMAARIICDKEFELTTCHFGRVHSNVTRLLRPVRKELRIGGTPLVEIDITNSQPLFLTACILAGITITWTSSQSYTFTTPITPNNTMTTTTSSQTQPSYTMVISNVSDCSDKGLMSYSQGTTAMAPDLVEFKEICEEGRLYDSLMTRTAWTDGKDKFKEREVFRVLYGTNTSFTSDGNYQPSRLQPVLESDFPTVWGFIRSYKRQHGYAELAREMQRQESRLMIEGVCGRLMDEHPDCPVVTIHDSIMTTSRWVETVSTTIRNEFGRIGLRPTLHVK